MNPEILYYIFNTTVCQDFTRCCLENKEIQAEWVLTPDQRARGIGGLSAYTTLLEYSYFFIFINDLLSCNTFSTKISHFFLKGQFLPLPLTKQVLKVSSTSANARFFLYVSLLKRENNSFLNLNRIFKTTKKGIEKKKSLDGHIFRLIVHPIV